MGALPGLSSTLQIKMASEYEAYKAYESRKSYRKIGDCEQSRTAETVIQSQPQLRDGYCGAGFAAKPQFKLNGTSQPSLNSLKILILAA